MLYNFRIITKNHQKTLDSREKKRYTTSDKTERRCGKMHKIKITVKASDTNGGQMAYLDSKKAEYVKAFDGFTITVNENELIKTFEECHSRKITLLGAEVVD